MYIISSMILIVLLRVNIATSEAGSSSDLQHEILPLCSTHPTCVGT